MTVFVEHRGVFHWLAQWIFKKPKVSQVHLERFGSFLFPLIDGSHSLYDIGQEISRRFGEEAEPLYPRLARYFQTLHACGLIEYKTGNLQRIQKKEVSMDEQQNKNG